MKIIFLTLQSATKIVKRSLYISIYNGLFALPKAEFIQYLFDEGGISELRYVRDMIFPPLKRRHNLPNAGALINRIHRNSEKDKLVKDIFTLYYFGKGNSKTLPKSLLKAPEVAQKSAQTDTESELNIATEKPSRKTVCNKMSVCRKP